MGQKYAVFDASGNIGGFYDSSDSPLPEGVVGVEISDDDWQTFLQGVNDGKLLRINAAGAPELLDAPAPTGATLVAINCGAQSALMATANAATYGMSDAFMLGMLNDADTATFKAWGAYKLTLSKVDLTQETPAWPALPTAAG
jgi:Caudovirales tail fibre assembly protein, lambda gpK